VDGKGDEDEGDGERESGHMGGATGYYGPNVCQQSLWMRDLLSGIPQG
jgi:hypothetical protein